MNTLNTALIAKVLDDSMAAAGLLDDYPEVVAEFTCYKELLQFHHEVKEGLKFINQYGNREEDLNIAEWDDNLDDAIVLITGDGTAIHTD